MSLALGLVMTAPGHLKPPGCAGGLRLSSQPAVLGLRKIKRGTVAVPLIWHVRISGFSGYPLIDCVSRWCLSPAWSFS